MTDFTFNVLHDQAQVSPSLKRAEHGHHKWVFSKGEDVALHEHLLDLVSEDQVLPVDLLHCKSLTGLFVSHQKNGPVWQPPKKLRGNKK